MKLFIFTGLLISLFGYSCGSSIQNIFSNKTPHEAFAADLDDNNLDKTPEGRQWLAASQTSLQDAQTITLPYRQHGFFGRDKSRALALQFKAKHGERITFNLSKKDSLPFIIFADVFRQGETATPLLSADTALSQFHFDADATGTFVLRLQPQLFHSGAYALSVSVGPSLGFPVSGSKARAGSFWGADRDGGKRRHEGIDIFAPKLTPAVAAADGYISGVREGGIGGKTVWMRTSEQNVYLYYAHLDKQLVEEGQAVKRGDTVGLVGNTGNAKYTPSHLHFGIYTYGGPIDPFPFVNKAVKTAPAVPQKNLDVALKLIKSQKDRTGAVVAANTLLVPLAAMSKGYIAELPNGNLIQTPYTSVKIVKQPVVQPGVVAMAPAAASRS